MTWHDVDLILLRVLLVLMWLLVAAIGALAVDVWIRGGPGQGLVALSLWAGAACMVYALSRMAWRGP